MPLWGIVVLSTFGLAVVVVVVIAILLCVRGGRSEKTLVIPDVLPRRKEA